MSTLERKEYQETKVMRTVSPGRNLRSSNQNLSEFDNNLDNLLEDLQNSVSRPGSALGNSNTYTRGPTKYINTSYDSSKSNSLNRIGRVQASNPGTEYSSDDAYSYSTPDGKKHVQGYKKESYSYKTSNGSTDIQPEKARVQKSINQLDSLLDDLQQVKNGPLQSSSSFERKEETYNNFGSSPGSRSSHRRELNYGDTSRSSSRSRTREQTEVESPLAREIDYSANEGSYGHIRTSSPSSRTSTLSKQVQVQNVQSYPVEVIETIAPEINPEVLAHLDPSLRPPGNTKVTTTIKTYTYEIPGSGNYPTNFDDTVDSSTITEKHVYSPNTTVTTPSKSFQYNKIENKTAQNVVTYPEEIQSESKLYKQSNRDYRYQRPPSPGGHSKVIKETVTTRNYQPGYSPEIIPPENKQTYIYNESTIMKDNDVRHYRPPVEKKTYILKETHKEDIVDEMYPPPAPPPTKETYIYKETHNTTNKSYPEPYPPPSKHETYIHKESHNTTNRSVSPYTNGYLPQDGGKTYIYEKETHTTNVTDGRPRQQPVEPVNIKYKYTTSSSTTNNLRSGYPEEQPLLPRPFPTDNRPEGPPKKLDELMANIGNEPPTSNLNVGYTVHEQDLIQQKKVKSLQQQATEADDMQRKEPVQRTKNVAGPPVYYPPGHELFAKKEESGAAWRAEGAYAKESGAYERGSEEKSKSKGASGAAIVPICLPCCCGLPCTIL